MSEVWGSSFLKDSSAGPSRFLSTAWTMVVQARDGEADSARRHMGLLIGRYWRPVFHFIRRFGTPREDAKDLTQGFFASFLEKGALSYADPERGKFRSFLLSCVKQYLARERSPASRPVELHVDFDSAFQEKCFAEVSDDPEAGFNRNWAKCLIENAVARLWDECEALGKPLQYDAFRRRILDGTSRRECAALLSVTEKDVDNLLASARTRLGRLLRDEVRSSVVEEGATDDEIQELFVYLRPQ